MCNSSQQAPQFYHQGKCSKWAQQQKSNGFGIKLFNFHGRSLCWFQRSADDHEVWWRIQSLQPPIIKLSSPPAYTTWNYLRKPSSVLVIFVNLNACFPTLTAIYLLQEFHSIYLLNQLFTGFSFFCTSDFHRVYLVLMWKLDWLSDKCLLLTFFNYGKVCRVIVSKFKYPQFIGSVLGGVRSRLCSVHTVLLVWNSLIPGYEYFVNPA